MLILILVALLIVLAGGGALMWLMRGDVGQRADGPACVLGAVALLLPILGTCTCTSLIGNVEQGGGPYARTGLTIWGAAFVLGLLCGVAGVLRRERPWPVPALAAGLNAFPAVLYVLIKMAQWLTA